MLWRFLGSDSVLEIVIVGIFFFQFFYHKDELKLTFGNFLAFEKVE